MKSTHELLIDTDGALSFALRGTRSGYPDSSPWWWYLELNGTPLYLVGNSCETCAAIFQRVRDTNLPLLPNELSTVLGRGLHTIPEDVVKTVTPLLPKGRYLVGLLDVTLSLGTAPDRSHIAGCEADYFWLRSLYSGESEAHFELVLPLVARSELNEERIAFYKTALQAGQRPTALALSIVDDRTLSGRFYEWTLAHFLLDGHHKVMAATQLAQPISLLSFLKLSYPTGYPIDERKVRPYYQ